MPETPNAPADPNAEALEANATDPSATDPSATEAPKLTPEALEAELAKTRKEAAKYRTRAKELEDARAAAEAERLKAAPLEERLKALEAERETLTKKAQDAELARTNAERRASITGKVVNPEAALKLWEEDDTVETFLERHPYMAPTPNGPTPTRGAAGGAMPRGKDPTKMTDDEFFRSRTEH